MANTNCLEGMACPKCQSEGPFKIEITTWMMVYDDGTDYQGGDTEWESESACGCAVCGYVATVKEFEIEHQEEADA